MGAGGVREARKLHSGVCLTRLPPFFFRPLQYYLGMIMSITKTSSNELLRRNLRRRIDELGLSDAEIARRAKMLPQQLCRYLSGQRNVPIGNILDRICEAVDMEPHEVLAPVD